MLNYIALLRGINVSGKHKIKMAELRDHLSNWGFAEAQTYIQSGNILFQSEELNSSILAERLYQEIKTTYGYEVPILVKNKKEWGTIVKQNPYVKRTDVEIKYCHITLLSESPATEKIELLEKLKPAEEYFQSLGKNIYLHLPKGYGRAKLTNNFIESKLKVQATTRNWKTVLKLWEMINSNKH